MSLRALWLVANGHARPHELLGLTFTRKAASEMHARVLSKLRRGQDGPPEAMHERRSWELARAALARNDELGWHLLEHPARLAIRTIDSFCAGLVRSMPWLSELGGMPEITDDARAHYEAAARATLELALAGLSRWLNWLSLSHGPVLASGPLPPHQRKVLLLLLTGLSEKQIASELNLSTNTAHQYVTALYRRFGARNRPSLTAKWLGHRP